MLKGDLRKQAILDTAEKLFFEKGYRDTTIQDMLDVLGCSKGSFYHHYESKLQVLSGLCSRIAEDGLEAYQGQTFDDPMARLNGLIYCAMPFRSGQENMLALLLPLEGLADGSVVQKALLDAQKELFFPEICRLLEMLKAAGLIHYYQRMLPEILWDAYTAVYQRMMAEAAALRSGGNPGNIIQLIETERFLWERLLDAPFGSMELIRCDEALATIDHALSILRRQDPTAS